jgi:hypothetical protein
MSDVSLNSISTMGAQEKSRIQWVIATVGLIGVIFGAALSITMHGNECKLPPGYELVHVPRPAPHN